MSRIPTIRELYDNIQGDLISKLNLSDGDLKKVLDVVSTVLAGQFKLSYLYLSDIDRNLFPDTADTAENGGTLSRHGIINLNRLRREATNGVYLINVTGQLNSELRPGLTFKSNDDSLSPGELYILDNAVSLNEDNQIAVISGNLVVSRFQIRSLKGGLDYALAIGDKLTITEPVIGVKKEVIVHSIEEIPISAETEEAYRKAILDSIQLEPQGGAKTDYRLWAADAQGVRFAYPYVKQLQPGTVQVFVEAVEEDSVDGNGTPTEEILNSVEEVIEFDPDETRPLEERGRRPIQATLEVLSVVLNPVDVTIQGLNENSPEIQDSIRENLKGYLKNIRPFIAGGDLARNKNDILYSARIQSVLTTVIDESNFYTNFTLFVNEEEYSSYLFDKGNIPYLRNLNFE